MLPAELYDERRLNTPKNLLVNPTGRFVIGGPVGDCGLTGRKIIVDTYGGMARHGGGAFSGKDPSKVDRSAAYAARYVAKNVVAAGLADRCEVQVAYAIGVAHPVSVMVETFGTERVPDARIRELIDEHFDLRPGAFRKYLDLHRPIFQKTAAYGHFGREDHDFTWEKTDKADALRDAAGVEPRPRARSRDRQSRAPGRRRRRWRRGPGQALLLQALRLRLRCLVQGLLDLLGDLLGLAHADEREVGVVGAGRVVVDRADLQDPLEHALLGVHVLDPVHARSPARCGRRSRGGCAAAGS